MGHRQALDCLSGAGLAHHRHRAAAPGLIQRINLTNRTEYNATPMAEAPHDRDQLCALLPWGKLASPSCRSRGRLPISPDQTRIFALTASGLTVLPSTFDAILAKPVVSERYSMRPT